MSGVLQHVSEGVFESCPYLIPQTRGSGTNKSLDATDPNTLHGGHPDATDAMFTGGELNQVSITIDTAATLTAYWWHAGLNSWQFCGGDATEYSKDFAARGTWVIRVRKGLRVYVSSSVEVAKAFISVPLEAG